MGFRDRDWYKDESKGTRPLAMSAVGALIGANVVAYLLQALAFKYRYGDLAESLWLMPADVWPGGRVWQLITSLFLHDPNNAFHIIFNMIVLAMFGPGVEARVGTRRFLTLYFGAGILAGITFVGFGLRSEPYIPAVGASGAIMGVAVYYAFLNPYDYILFLFMIPMRIVYAMAIVVGLDLYHFVFSPPGGTGVAHTAHLGGALFGWLFYRLGGRSPRRARGSRGATADEVGLKARVDSLLDKIHQQGMDSLTPEERDFLQRASRAYRGEE